MAGAMVGEGTSYPDLKVTEQKLNSELYGVGCRKGSDLTSFINSVMSAAYADGHHGGAGQDLRRPGVPAGAARL